MGDLPDDVRTHFRDSGGYEILKKLLLVEKTTGVSQISDSFSN